MSCRLISRLNTPSFLDSIFYPKIFRPPGYTEAHAALHEPFELNTTIRTKHGGYCGCRTAIYSRELRVGLIEQMAITMATSACT